MGLLHLRPLGRIQRKKLGLLWKSNERKQFRTYLRTSWSWWTRQGIHIICLYINAEIYKKLVIRELELDLVPLRVNKAGRFLRRMVRRIHVVAETEQSLHPYLILQVLI
jgi:hypothetical protein